MKLLVRDNRREVEFGCVIQIDRSCAKHRPVQRTPDRRDVAINRHRQHGPRVVIRVVAEDLDASRREAEYVGRRSECVFEFRGRSRDQLFGCCVNSCPSNVVPR